MLAPEFSECHMAPMDPAEQFDHGIQQAAFDFYRRLFSRERTESGYTDDLEGIVAADFVEDDHPEAYHEEGHVAARGLEGLRRYRANFDAPDGTPPELAHLDAIAVPASETWIIPGTNEHYNFGAVIEFSVKGPMGKIFQVRLREDLLIKENPETGLLEVSRRMYRGIGDGEQGYLGPDTDPRNHHELVGRQITHIMEHGESSPLAPLYDAYQSLFPSTDLVDVA